MQEVDNILTKTRSQIKPVEAPDYILTRAKQRFENLKEVVTPKFVWSTTLATLTLVIFNVYVIGQQTKATSVQPDQGVELMISSSNQLYADE